MKIPRTLIGCIPLLFTLTLSAQPQIGGGTCDSSTLNGPYSITLTGRDVGASVGFSNVLQGVGTATFDGLNKISIVLTNNTNKGQNVPQTLAGTYSMQANCIGAINITAGDAATFTLGTFASGNNFFIDGQDGVYSFTGNGSALPTGCTASILSGTYPFNGNAFGLNATAISSVNFISGVFTFDGTNAMTATLYISGSTAPVQLTGKFTVISGCTGTATLADSSGNSYAIEFTITAAKGNNFLIGGASSKLMFVGSARIL